MRWTRMEDDEVEKLFATSKEMIGPRVSSFIYFLTEATEDFMVYQGDVYKRIKDGA